MNGYPDNVMLEDVKCPNGCEKGDEFLLNGRDRIHDIPGEFSLYRCRACGLQRTTPRPTASTIGVYYPSDYEPYHLLVDSQSASRSGINSWVVRLLGLQSKVLPAVSPGKMLEIGCSSGAYMELARSQGWQVDGVEFSEEAAGKARGKGFNVSSGPIENVNLPDNAYDMITAWMVLEHLHDPISVLRKLRGVISESGYMVASVPDADSLARYVFKDRCYDLHLPAHLYHYTPKTISALMEKTGWKLVKVRWQRNPNTLLASFSCWSKEKNKLIRFAEWLKSGSSARYIRLVLSVVLGLTRQSGRIEIWAVPTKNEYYP